MRVKIGEQKAWIVCGAGCLWLVATDRDQGPGNRGIEEGENVECRTLAVSQVERLNFELRSTEENPEVRGERMTEWHVPCA